MSETCELSNYELLQNDVLFGFFEAKTTFCAVCTTRVPSKVAVNFNFKHRSHC